MFIYKENNPIREADFFIVEEFEGDSLETLVPETRNLIPVTLPREKELVHQKKILLR